MSHSIKFFMWSYQRAFKQAMQYRATELLRSIAPALQPKALLVGVKNTDNPDGYPVCLEPEDGEWMPQMYADCAQRAEKIYAQHPDHNLFYGDEARTRDKPENIRKKSVQAAVKEATEQFDKQQGLTTFYGWPVSVNGYDVVPMLQFENLQLNLYPKLARQIEWINFKSYNSFLDSVIEKLLQEASAALSSKEPGRFFDTFDTDKTSILRRAGSSFASVLSLVAQDIELQGVFESLNEISAKRYEGTSAIGEILFSSKKTESINYNITFKAPVALRNYRLARKVVELSGSELCCICTGAEGISGLGFQNDQEADDVFRVIFSGYYKWDLYQGRKLLMKSSFGVPDLPSVRLQKEVFQSTVQRVFASQIVLNIEKLWLIIESSMEQKHGTMIVLSDIAAQEAERLSTQSIKIQPVELTPDLVRRISSIDGAILIDPQGICWAIGVILDGMATEDGDPSRGARFNSAVRYSQTSAAPVICLVVSEDGYVDMLPQLLPQIRLSELEQKIRLLKTKNINNYRETISWLEQYRFYCTTEQCESINQELIRIESAPRDAMEIRLKTEPFVPDEEMNDIYYLPESS